MNGGDQIAACLAARGVRFLFTLCGGHISPILVGCKRRGIRVADVRHEATAVFAADAVSRLTGVPGVAAVTAGPGVTNTITALKNAQLAQSPLILLGGAAATVLQGRGALQDIDQLALIRPHVKAALRARRVRDLVPHVEEAFEIAQSGVPGPVFVECPIDLLYEESLVRSWYGKKSSAPKKRSVAERAESLYLDLHVDLMFRGSADPAIHPPAPPRPAQPSRIALARAQMLLARAQRPVILVGSQALTRAEHAGKVAAALERLGLPVYLSGMARGLLGAHNRLQLRHKRREALREADLVVLAGVPCDFRLDYGRHIRRSTKLISVSRSRVDRARNRNPTVGIDADPGQFLIALAESGSAARGPWLESLRARDGEREHEIEVMSREKTDGLNPVATCRELERAIGEDSVIVADG